jgi:hypothetical protein
MACWLPAIAFKISQARTDGRGIAVSRSDLVIVQPLLTPPPEDLPQPFLDPRVGQDIIVPKRLREVK